MGAGIVLLAFFLFTRNNELSGRAIFMWASIGVMYIAFFTPFFFSLITIGNFSVKIPSVTMVWFGIFVYIPVSIGIIVLLQFLIISLNLALILQSVTLFVLLLVIYFGYFASSQVGNVAVEEAHKLQPLAEIKNAAALLALRAGSLSAEYENAQKLIRRSADEIRYLSPVDQDRSAQTDGEILSVIKILTELCTGASEGGHSSLLDDKVKKLESLVKERKLLRN
jgi:signal transduction histidine kinase